jgi:hypothetical protein
MRINMRNKHIRNKGPFPAPKNRDPKTALLRIRIRCFFDPWIRDPGGIKKIKLRIRDEHPGSYFREIRNNFLGVKIIKFLDADPDPECFWPWIRVGKNSYPGSEINIPDPQHCKTDTGQIYTLGTDPDPGDRLITLVLLDLNSDLDPMT